MIHSFRLPFALFLFLFSVYLLTYTPRINSSDGLAMFATAESLVRRGALDIEQIRWMDLQQGTFGLDGLLYSRKGIGVPLALLPLTWLGLVVPWFGMVTTSLLFNGIVTALTAVMLFVYLSQLGFQVRTGLIVALTFGLTSLAWPYAKSLFSDPFSGLLLLSAAYCLRRNKSGRIFPFLAGLFLAWNCATRYAEAIFVPLFGFWILDFGFWINLPIQNPKSKIQNGIVFTTPLAITLLALFTFNYSRYGSLLNTGYLPNETFSGDLWQGLMGQLISPARGLFLYCPVFILSFFGIALFWQRHRAETALAFSIILLHLLLYGKWFMWHGGYAWGPRFLVPTLPFWAMALAPLVETWQTEKPTFLNKLGFYSYLTLAALGLIPQFLSVIIDFAPFQNSLLETGLPLFAPETFFEWQYSPFIGAWPFINKNSLDLVWAWHGQINVALLLLLVSNIVLTGLNIITNYELRITKSESVIGNSQFVIDPVIGNSQFVIESVIRNSQFVIGNFTLGTTIFLLIQAHTLSLEFPAQPVGFSQAVAVLNHEVHPTDTVILNDPTMTMDFAELYKGRAAVSIWQSGGFPLPPDLKRRLTEIIDENQNPPPTPDPFEGEGNLIQNPKFLWWLPNGLAPEKSAVEQTLLAKGFHVWEERFNGQRMALFAFSNNLSPQTVPAKTTFYRKASSDSLHLVSISYTSPMILPATFLIELHWQAVTPISQNYHAFVHLVNSQGNIIAQADGQPVNWTRPTSTWQVGETIIDRHAFQIPPNTPAGNYQVQIGWYHPTDGSRLLLLSGEESVKFELRIKN